MSDSDTSITSGMAAAASAAADAPDSAEPSPGVALATLPAFADDATEWSQAGNDHQAPWPQDFDLVSGAGNADWFTATPLPFEDIAIGGSDDPLVSLAQTEPAGSSALDDGAALSGFSSPDHGPHTSISAHDIMSMPPDYGTPLDHIEWYFAGLLPLA